MVSTERDIYRAQVLNVPALVNALTDHFVSAVERMGWRPSKRWPDIEALRAEVTANLTKNIDRIHPTAERKVEIGARLKVWPTYEEWRDSRSGGVSANR